MIFETVATLLMALIGFQASQHWGSIHMHSKTGAERGKEVVCLKRAGFIAQLSCLLGKGTGRSQGTWIHGAWESREMCMVASPAVRIHPLSRAEDI